MRLSCCLVKCAGRRATVRQVVSEPPWLRTPRTLNLRDCSLMRSDPNPRAGCIAPTVVSHDYLKIAYYFGFPTCKIPVMKWA
jgi:hypothetical protein